MIADTLCFICDGLAELPGNLPATLKRLDCTFNNITSIPDNLPTGLTYLNFQYNAITTMPSKLPPALKELYCGHNQITSLPDNLPCTLTNFSCSKNKITQLPTHLPSILEYLDCSDNQLTLLPDTLPDTLEFIFVKNNPLEANYPKIFTFRANKAKEIIAYVRDCNAKRRTKERLRIINAGNVLLERYMRRRMHPDNFKALTDDPDIDVDEYMTQYVEAL